MKFEFVDDLTSDVMFKAYGNTLGELIENSGFALFSVMCDIKKVKLEKSVVIEISGENEEDLIYNWLSELLTQQELENMFFSKFEVLKLEKNKEYKLRVKVFGQEIKNELILTVVKAVTYHKFSVEKKDKWIATVVLDVWYNERRY